MALELAFKIKLAKAKAKAKANHGTERKTVSDYVILKVACKRTA